jgi:hypothetical protein
MDLDLDTKEGVLAHAAAGYPDYDWAFLAAASDRMEGWGNARLACGLRWCAVHRRGPAEFTRRSGKVVWVWRRHHVTLGDFFPYAGFLTEQGRADRDRADAWRRASAAAVLPDWMFRMACSVSTGSKATYASFETAVSVIGNFVLRRRAEFRLSDTEPMWEGPPVPPWSTP